MIIERLWKDIKKEKNYNESIINTRKKTEYFPNVGTIMVNPKNGRKYKIKQIFTKQHLTIRYSSLVEIENIESHPQRFIKTIIINDCNNSRLEKVKELLEPEVENIKSYLENKNINCSKIEDYYYDENSINIVYEYIEVKELTEKSWDEAKIIKFLQNILPTLQKLHDNKIIHGNIKPSNFLEQNSTYFLLDFGFVTKISELTFDEQNKVKNRSIQGTKGYRAQEVKEGFEAQPYSDIYSLGITIIELLIRKAPQKFKNQDDEIIWELVKQISPNVIQILKKMVESDYRNRYNNVQEILDRLDKDEPNFVIFVIKFIKENLQQSKPSKTPKSKKSDSVPSTRELLFRSAFTGFEGVLLALALASLLGTMLITTWFWLWLSIILMALIFIQSRYQIKILILPLIAIITFCLVCLIPGLSRVIENFNLHNNNPFLMLLVMAIFGGGIIFTLMALWLLIARFNR